MSTVTENPFKDDLTDAEKEAVERMIESLGLNQAPITEEERLRALEAITQARISLLFKYPFWGQLALGFKIVDGTDWLPIPTAGTDGVNIYIHAGFVNKLRPAQVLFLLAHEISHVMYDHLPRRADGDLSSKRYNIAGDHVINLMLKKNKIGEVIDQIKIYADPKYDGWTTEEVYADLPENAGEGGGDGGDGLPMDNHFPSQGSPDDIRRAILEASGSCSPDEVPDFARSIIKDLTEPEMDWTEMLSCNIESSIVADFTWMKMSRKGWHIDSRLPGGAPGKTVNVAIAIDTSGSISDSMLEQFLSEIAGIMEQFDQYKLCIWQFDTSYYGYDEFTNEDGRDITEYDIRGGGGTDFKAIFKCLEDKEIVPDQLVVFTDGETYDWGNSSYCDTLFVINNRYHRNIEPPYGQVAFFSSGS